MATRKAAGAKPAANRNSPKESAKATSKAPTANLPKAAEAAVDAIGKLEHSLSGVEHAHAPPAPTAVSRKAVLNADPARLPYERVALVLQGGGALGSYQGGVYQGLAETGIHPNWVSGISIGALNSAIIAGNAPKDRVDKLQGFWQTITQPGFSVGSTELVQSMVERLDGDLRRAANGFEAWRAIIEGQRGFFYPRVPPTFPGSKLPPSQVSFYDTAVLKNTLELFADFDRINSGETRVSVSAVDVHSGNVKVFDSVELKQKNKRMLPEHFMASGALPPGFPAVEIDGRFYWDGGLVTNTPLFPVLLERPRADTLVFQVDLFSARGELPQDLAEVEARRKDITFSSRTRMATQYMEEIAHHRRLLREVLKSIPADSAVGNKWCEEAGDLALHKQYNIIHLIYRSKPFEGSSKDYEFSPVTMRDHWKTGLADFRRTREHPDWFDLPPDEKEYVTHDVHRQYGGDQF